LNPLADAENFRKITLRINGGLNGYADRLKYWERAKEALTNPEMRLALFQIWFNRNYQLYAGLVEKDLTLAQWRPADLMRMYIRKDITAQLWNYGVAAAPAETIADPYEGKGIERLPDRIVGETGSLPGQFQAPRGLAVAPDGSLYLADSKNYRIQHLSPTGEVLHVWGSFADILAGDAPPGTFNEPWDVAVGPDGAVYVTDTWNHRVQKFTADGQFLTMWGFFGTAETPAAFWGPRSVEVDAQGQVFVSDTGNKRVVIFGPDGDYINQFGVLGFGPGQFDEPVGLALGSDGQVFIADTWNQRMQVMIPTGANAYSPLMQWDVVGWYGSSLENKPYLAADPQNGRLFVADPEGYRVLEFSLEGEFIQYWGDFSTGTDGFGLVSGLAVDPNGGLWVSDGANNRLLHFTLP